MCHCCSFLFCFVFFSTNLEAVVYLHLDKDILASQVHRVTSFVAHSLILFRSGELARPVSIVGKVLWKSRTIIKMVHLPINFLIRKEMCLYYHTISSAIWDAWGGICWRGEVAASEVICMTWCRSFIFQFSSQFNISFVTTFDIPDDEWAVSCRVLPYMRCGWTWSGGGVKDPDHMAPVRVRSSVPWPLWPPAALQH